MRTGSGAAAAVAASALLGVGFASQAPAGAVNELSASSWNMGMGLNGADADNYFEKNPLYSDAQRSVRTRELAIASVSSHRPWTAGFQEICQRQFENMVLALGPLGYEASYVPTNNAQDCTAIAGEQIRGNAIFSLGTATGTPITRRIDLFPFGGDHKGEDTDNRSYICNDVSPFPGFRYLGCTLHASSNRTNAAYQVSWAREQILFDQAARGIGLSIYGGDFNIKPSEGAYCHHDNYTGSTCNDIRNVILEANATHVEAHDIAANFSTHFQYVGGGFEKIDYVFATRAFISLNYKQPASPLYREDGSGKYVSDHFYVGAEYRLN